MNTTIYHILVYQQLTVTYTKIVLDMKTHPLRTGSVIVHNLQHEL